MPQPWKPPLQSPRLWAPGIPLLLEHFRLLGQEAEVLQPSAALELDSQPSPKLHVEPLWKGELTRDGNRAGPEAW